MRSSHGPHAAIGASAPKVIFVNHSGTLRAIIRLMTHAVSAVM